jgi:hypothetical protein
VSFLRVPSEPPNTIIRLFAASQTELCKALADGGVPVGDNRLHDHKAPFQLRVHVSLVMDPSEPPNTIIRLFAASQTALCKYLADGAGPAWNNWFHVHVAPSHVRIHASFILDPS